MTDVFTSSVSRRTLFGGTLGLAGLAALSACGGSGTGGGATGTGSTAAQGPTALPTGTRKRGGTFRFAPQDASSGDTMDPQSATGVSWALASAMFNGLMILDHQMSPHLSLAEVFEPESKDQGSWTLRLKQGVEFHNGKTVSAQDVIYSIRRILDPSSPGFTSGLMGSIDAKHGLTAVDKRTVKFKLNYPNSQLKQIFWQVPTAIVPTDFNPAKPVGTGPFKFKSNTPGQRFVGVRNENYFAGEVYLDQLELVTFADAGTARFNALATGQIDGINNVDPVLLSQLRSHSDLLTVISNTGAFEPIAMRCGKGDQFEDVRTRTAMKLIANRPAMISTAYSGLGAAGNDVGVWSQWDPGMAEVAAREQDIDRAKSLLKAAGTDGMTINLRIGEVVPGQLAAAQELAQEAKKAGITINIDKVADLSQFYSSKSYYTSQMKNDYLFTESLFLNMLYCWQKDSWSNNTSYNNPKLNSMFKAALAKPEAEYQTAMQDVGKLVYEDGPWMVWGRRNVIDAMSTKFTGLVQDAGGMGFNQFRWEEISLA
ncbi:MAG: ABC transporter substrate-binding protein [Nocardioides sp.]|uniref:ABC transporter substrate-binding protein n=1 Tax=Nocardioides sp. TaxID=35761 RepID=UPI0039E4AC63